MGAERDGWQWSIFNWFIFVLFVIKNFGLNLSKLGLISVKIRSNMKCLTGQLSWKSVRNFPNFRNSSISVTTEFFCVLNPKTLRLYTPFVSCYFYKNNAAPLYSMWREALLVASWGHDERVCSETSSRLEARCIGLATRVDERADLVRLRVRRKMRAWNGFFIPNSPLLAYNPNFSPAIFPAQDGGHRRIYGFGAK
jgi:hypothetical protein